MPTKQFIYLFNKQDPDWKKIFAIIYQDFDSEHNIYYLCSKHLYPELLHSVRRRMRLKNGLKDFNRHIKDAELP